MSFWSDNVELADEITTDNLPEPWYTRVTEDGLDLYDVPEEIRDKAFNGGSADWFGDQIDAAMLHKDEILLQEALTKEDKPIIDNGVI